MSAMTSRTAALLILVALAVRCGGQSTTSPDPASENTIGRDASVSSPRPSLDGGAASDAKKPKTGLKLPKESGPPPSYDFVEVDGGKDCDGGNINVCLNEVRGCCNGVMCKGYCLLFEGHSDPVCMCAGVDGGCPGDWVCLGACAPSEGCNKTPGPY